MAPGRFNQNYMSSELAQRAPGLKHGIGGMDAGGVVETMIEDRERSGNPMDEATAKMARHDPERFLQMMRSRMGGGRPRRPMPAHRGNPGARPLPGGDVAFDNGATWQKPAPGYWN